VRPEGFAIDMSQLVPWTTVLRETQGPGTLSSMTRIQKERVDESVFEFLAQHLEPEEIPLCKVMSGKKEYSALPGYLQDAFANWLGDLF
jgi:hypothetical protein